MSEPTNDTINDTTMAAMPSEIGGFEVRTTAVLSNRHCTLATADGRLFENTDEHWRLYGVTDCHAQYYFGCDQGIIDTQLAPIVGPDMAALFTRLRKLGFVEVRFDKDGPEHEDIKELWDSL